MTILQQVELALSESKNTTFTSGEIKKLMSDDYAIKPTSVLPSDYCYNRTNFGIDKSGKFSNKFLIHNSDGTYTYVGFDFSFNGCVYHKPQGSKVELVVGYFNNGEFFAITQTQNDIEDLSNNTLIEGATKKISVNSYERNTKARQQCIEYHDCKCWVCEFDFFEAYGELGKDFIHVHHIVPLSEIRQGYEVDPINDLLPLCPNCHAMVHRQIPTMVPKELKLLLARVGRS